MTESSEYIPGREHGRFIPARLLREVEGFFTDVVDVFHKASGLRDRLGSYLHGSDPPPPPVPAVVPPSLELMASKANLKSAAAGWETAWELGIPPVNVARQHESNIISAALALVRAGGCE